MLGKLMMHLKDENGERKVRYFGMKLLVIKIWTPAQNSKHDHYLDAVIHEGGEIAITYTTTDILVSRGCI